MTETLQSPGVREWLAWMVASGLMLQLALVAVLATLLLIALLPFALMSPRCNRATHWLYRITRRWL